ncbi:A24 family peptidase [Roseovarius arcticus]|uniref:A24 family peptidase n=1 Tax=Roseovarius arcticus TaxID=2547404 RepID=UPI00111049E4|nr:prepilin peptidase [Roseovarius arcticus]
MNAPPVISVGWLVIPLLLAVIAYDMRFMRIPNWLVTLFVIVAICSLPFSVSWIELKWRLIAGAGVFLVSLLIFAQRLIGGGDVKLLTALTLLIPVCALQLFGMILSLSIFASVLALFITRRAMLGRPTRWLAISDRSGFPMGLAIGVAGIIFWLFGPNLMRMITG